MLAFPEESNWALSWEEGSEGQIWKWANLTQNRDSVTIERDRRIVTEQSCAYGHWDYEDESMKRSRNDS